MAEVSGTAHDALGSSHLSHRIEDRSASEAADGANIHSGAPLGMGNAPPANYNAEEKGYKWRWMDFGKHDGARFRSQFLPILRRIATHKDKIFKHGCKGEGWELVLSELLNGDSGYDFSLLKVKTLKAKYKLLAHDIKLILGPYMDTEAPDGSDPAVADEWTRLWLSIFKYEQKQLEANVAPGKVSTKCVSLQFLSEHRSSQNISDSWCLHTHVCVYTHTH
jgi:hypothetical protein